MDIIITVVLVTYHHGRGCRQRAHSTSAHNGMRVRASAAEKNTKRARRRRRRLPPLTACAPPNRSRSIVIGGGIGGGNSRPVSTVVYYPPGIAHIASRHRTHTRTHGPFARTPVPRPGLVRLLSVLGAATVCRANFSSYSFFRCFARTTPARRT